MSFAEQSESSGQRHGTESHSQLPAYVTSFYFIFTRAFEQNQMDFMDNPQLKIPSKVYIHDILRCRHNWN